MKFILDTDHVSILERPASPQAAAILSKIVALETGDVGVSVVSY